MDKLQWNTVVNMINMYKSNNTSKLSPDQIACMNLVRDIFIKADPLPVNVVKRFENDQELVEYYGNLEKKYNGPIKLNGAHGIFDKTFVVSPIMKAYADKFYKRRLNLAASHLSDVFKYQMANAITQNKPLPLLTSDTANDYMQLLYQKAEIAANVQNAIDTNTNERLSVCSNILNNLVEDVLLGSHNGYYVNNCLNEQMKHHVYRFRNNITYLLNSPLTLSTNVYNLIEQTAVKNGQTPTAEPPHPNYKQSLNTIQPQQHLTDMAFENEALRRAKIQELNIRYADLAK
ncbi:gp41 [Matsumuraeses phaseoli granulovirus]|uniref:Gp41 n=1 Tax=Matsumuraeses phaseoli granulovirus TaxID=2760664 RepID=A0AAE7MLG1_9BBAC|nr:gp41 [Matsumuraeses phaseoli granulovirus]QOD40057.1 gp41 [Matsumuraeses phaseoli granulovirus]